MAESLAREHFERELEEVAAVAFRVALGLAREPESAMDLVQDAALQAYRAFHTFETGTNFRAWFLRILTNRYFRTRSKRHPETVPLDEVGDIYLYRKTREAGLHGNSDDPARIVLDGLDVEEVHKALAALPDEFRAVAVLYFVSDFSYEHIASILEVPIGTVRSRLHRGRKLLQKALWDVAVERGVVTSVPGGSSA